MIRKSKSKQKTVAEKVEELLHGGSDNENDSSDGDEFTAPKVTDFDDNEYELPDAQTTDIRKRNIKLLSEQSSRYAGAISTREELGLDGDDSSVYDEEGSFANEHSDDEGNMYEDEDDMNESESDEAFDDSASDVYNTNSEPDENELSNVMPKANLQAEIQKGLCVQNQLRIWERLLELRIQLQKVLTKTNQLPQPTILTKMKAEQDEMQDINTQVVNNTSLLLASLLKLQTQLFAQFPEVKDATKTLLKRPCPFASSSESTTKRQLTEQLETEFSEFRAYRNSVLLKWDDRTKLLTAKGGAKKNLQNEEYDIIKKIDNTLLNKSGLIERSQTVKLPTTTTNEADLPDEPKRDGNVYDDSDFYHQQLRELIEYKTNSASSMSEVTKQFVELQKLRQKIKKKVDTRASKGRKLRYAVHNKLINFMAPNDASTWTEESKDELAKSLFV